MDKKISIISIFDNANFGTYLQNLALAKTLEYYGCTVETVNYCRENTQLISLIKKKEKQQSILKIILQYIIEILSMNRQKKAYKQFIQTSIKYNSIKKLKETPPIADIYMTGSDQVWNSIYNNGVDPAFFLDYAPKNKPCYAYAASIGMEEIPNNEKKKTYSLLNKYTQITVREKLAQEILCNLGVKNIQVVADPTLLLTKLQWKEFASKRLINSPYLLIYSVESKEQNKIVYSIAQKVASKKKLKTVSINSRSFLSDVGKCDYNFHFSTFKHFLSLFLYSDFIVVSSFHGTAFAINFQKQFLTVSPSKFNSRIDNLLEICQLKERKVTMPEDYSIKTLKIDYNKVNEKLNVLRNESIKTIIKWINTSL